jgi:ATPase subunit of ABC transporter with duplicated ATPase domains
VRQLTESLNAYHGARLVVSHDRHFLDGIGLDVTLELTKTRLLARAT